MTNKEILEIIYIFIYSTISALIFTLILNIEDKKKWKKFIIITLLLFFTILFIDKVVLDIFLKHFKGDLIRKLYNDIWTTN